jgi:probable DNA metabolism protein
MTTMLYDGSFEGFLTVIFEIYNHKLLPEKIASKERYQPHIFDTTEDIGTDEEKAKRVWSGLCKKISAEAQKTIYYTFLSEEDGVEMTLYRYIKRILATNHKIEQDFGDADILKTWQIAKKVAHESHRVIMFVRFQKTADDIYFAGFDPQYDVLPMSLSHFKDRFADQKWVLYDTRRDYGFYYDLQTITEINLTNSTIDFKTSRLKEEAMAEDELAFQKLWKIYYTEMAIKERLNLKLQRQHMPKRFWKYLVEKW